MAEKHAIITICEEDPRSVDAVLLLDELSDELEALAGSSGRASFNVAEMDGPRAVFAVARNELGYAVGCGAIRPMGETTAEIKRVYAREKGSGIGSAVLAFLEKRAGELRYATLRLETRKLNTGAIAFYLAKGYREIENFGKYKGREEAICFEKELLL
jgi:ribosomal protein S18 acetylase RimI-like enzyme